ncbi:MAG: hypothetical protein CM15mP126_0670 [Gammaproteobacteria bacterium]|nr:MAG: hypothetical protein CM15mP126_0670 [Gammaproteobacteria bacterium]
MTLQTFEQLLENSCKDHKNLVLFLIFDRHLEYILQLTASHVAHIILVFEEYQSYDYFQMRLGIYSFSCGISKSSAIFSEQTIIAAD